MKISLRLISNRFINPLNVQSAHKKDRIPCRLDGFEFGDQHGQSRSSSRKNHFRDRRLTRRHSAKRSSVGFPITIRTRSNSMYLRTTQCFPKSTKRTEAEFTTCILTAMTTSTSSGCSLPTKPKIASSLPTLTS